MRWALTITLIFGLCGCGGQDADQLAQVGRKAMTKLENVAGGSHGKLAIGYQAVRGSLSDMTLDSKVATRLLWEKTLEDSEIAVNVVHSGTVKLVGRVPDFPQRQRAEEVARATVGVKEVVNELVVAQ